MEVPGTAADEALSMVAAVRDDPARRVELASTFYDDREGRASIRAYRRAELAFMRWQVSRGVLAPPGSQRPGSRWWRSVNEGLLRDAWEADRLLAGRPGSASRPAVSRGADFLRRPSSSVIRDGAAPTCSSPCTASCLSGIRCTA
jgi:hypothetical protein